MNDEGPQIISQEERESLRAEKVIKKHLFGVQPPADKKIFDDMAACFDYFRSNCELKDAIEKTDVKNADIRITIIDGEVTNVEKYEACFID